MLFHLWDNLNYLSSFKTISKKIIGSRAERESSRKAKLTSKTCRISGNGK